MVSSLDMSVPTAPPSHYPLLHRVNQLAGAQARSKIAEDGAVVLQGAAAEARDRASAAEATATALEVGACPALATQHQSCQC